MGVEIRKTIKLDGCACYLLPFKKKGEQVRLCYHKGILGALSDAQEIKYCTPQSFVPKQEGGTALDIRSEKVQEMVATMKGFGEATQRAHEKYQADVQEDGERDMDRWRKTVAREAVKRTPLPMEKPRKMTKAEKLEARKDPLEAAFDAAMEKEERAHARKGQRRVNEDWDSASLGDYN